MIKYIINSVFIPVHYHGAIDPEKLIALFISINIIAFPIIIYSLIKWVKRNLCTYNNRVTFIEYATSFEPSLLVSITLIITICIDIIAVIIFLAKIIESYL